MSKDRISGPQDIKLEKSSSVQRINRVARLYEFERQVDKENREFYRLPPWRRAELEGDYLVEDSGINIGDGDAGNI